MGEAVLPRRGGGGNPSALPENVFSMELCSVVESTYAYDPSKKYLVKVFHFCYYNGWPSFSCYSYALIGNKLTERTSVGINTQHQVPVSPITATAVAENGTLTVTWSQFGTYIYRGAIFDEIK